MSGLDMLSNAVTALLSIFNDGDPRHGRLQELMMDVKQMVRPELAPSQMGKHWMVSEHFVVVFVH